MNKEFINLITVKKFTYDFNFQLHSRLSLVETPVVEEIKEVAPPVEVVETETVVEEKQEEEKKEVEWVLPASIKVEK